MKYKVILSVAITSIILNGCSATYEPPTPVNLIVKETHDMSIQDAMKKAKKVLMTSGYTIQSYDDKEGLISTSEKKYKVSTSEAICGKTMGIDYLKDYRTQTQVSINVFIDSKSISIKANINGYYKPGSSIQDIDLICNSKGTIEKDLIQKIIN